MGKRILDLISVFSGLITIASAYGLYVGPKHAKAIGLSGANLTTLFWGSLVVMCFTGGPSAVKIVKKKQFQFGGRNNTQNMG